MNILQGFVFFVLLLGFISSSSECNLLLKICFSFGSCHSNDTYLKLTPINFDPNLHDYTIHIPRNYSLYTSTGSMRVEFYVLMNTSDFDYEKRSVAKSVLYDANEKQVLAVSDLAYSSNEMLIISAQLWPSADGVTMYDDDNQIMTKLIVYQFNSDSIQQSDPYTLTFKRNE